LNGAGRALLDGRRIADGRTWARPPRGEVHARAFAGIHACSPRVFDLVTERGAFPIVALYLRLAAAGHRVLPWAATGTWLEIGSAERLEAARAALER